MAGTEKYGLNVNKQHHFWEKQFITGSEIKTLAKSPADWVVNQIVPGRGEDPEIGDAQPVDLSEHAEPKGVKKFTTRKPSTTPGKGAEREPVLEAGRWTRSTRGP